MKRIFKIEKKKFLNKTKTITLLKIEELKHKHLILEQYASDTLFALALSHIYRITNPLTPLLLFTRHTVLYPISQLELMNTLPSFQFKL